MKTIRTFSLLALALLLSGCGFVHDERLTGDYRLIAVDVMEQMSISLSLPGGSAVGRIDETVFSVGWNERYIVAKQHPDNNRAVTHYYFLDTTRDSTHAEPGQSVTGPLTEAEFTQHKAELKLPDFQRTFKELQ